MSHFFGLSSLFFSLFRKILFLWVRTEIVDADKDKLQLDPDKPVCYVLQYSSFSARLVLENTCMKLGLPSAQAKLPLGQDTVRRSFFFLYERQGSWFRKRQSPIVTARLKQMVHDVASDEDVDVQIVPVSLFWGRSPEKEKSWLKLLLTENWSVTGPFQKLLVILIHGRRTFVQFGRPLSLQRLYTESEKNEELTARKTARILRVHFRRIRQTVLGPDLSHRRTLVHSIVMSSTIRRAIDEKAEEDDISREKAQAIALSYADEIASNLQISTIHFLERLLAWVWNKIFDGVTINNLDVVKDVTRDNAVVYVPSHRSHIDYLLLSSRLFKEGIMVPHIAAGINLNIPIVGAILRRGGAFFMRRSFKNNKLYSAVFSEYIHAIFSRGYSVEYFVEGGRSRTGRTLSPRTGMIAMTVNSFLRDSTKPIAFVPVYFCYEKVLEGSTYLGELRGKKKQKESIFGLFKSLKNLRKSFGKVQVNFGKPIYLKDYLDEHAPDWKTASKKTDEKPEWFPGVVNSLAQEIVTRINSASTVNAVNLAAMVLLSTNRYAMDARVLAKQMNTFANLLKDNPYSDYMTLPEGDGFEWLQYVEEMGFVARRSLPLGDVICLEERNAVMLTYNRNMILHFFALPALIASLFQHNETIKIEKVYRIVRAVYPYIKSELFIRWSRDELESAFHSWLRVLTKYKLLIAEGDTIRRPGIGSEEFVQLEILARVIMQTLERYYITIAILRQQGPGHLTAEELELRSTQIAERMSILFGLNAPEFFDKSLFRTFIQQLRNNDMLLEDQENKLIYRERIDEIEEDAKLVLNAELRQAIIQVTQLH